MGTQAIVLLNESIFNLGDHNFCLETHYFDTNLFLYKDKHYTGHASIYGDFPISMCGSCQTRNMINFESPLFELVKINCVLILLGGTDTIECGLSPMPSLPFFPC